VSFYVRSSVIFKSIKYSVLFLLIILIETVTLPLALKGAVLPDLVLGAVIACAFGEDERVAGVCGLAAGFVLDALGSFGVALSPLLYGLAGYLAGVMIRFFMRRNLPSFMIYMLSAAAARAVFTVMLALLNLYTVDISILFFKTVIPEFFLTVLFSPLLYLIIALPLARKNKQSLKN
jgi:rod shape-determining protein MreD